MSDLTTVRTVRTVEAALKAEWERVQGLPEVAGHLGRAWPALAKAAAAVWASERETVKAMGEFLMRRREDLDAGDALATRWAEVQRAASKRYLRRWPPTGWVCDLCNGYGVHDDECLVGLVLAKVEAGPPAVWTLLQGMSTEELRLLQTAHTHDQAAATAPESIMFGAGRLALIAAVLRDRGDRPARRCGDGLGHAAECPGCPECE